MADTNLNELPLRIQITFLRGETIFSVPTVAVGIFDQIMVRHEEPETDDGYYHSH
jgi:hypothetical protein